MTGAVPGGEWNAFWNQAGNRRTGPSCLPGAGGSLGEILRAVWEQFAKTLPHRAAVLDLATGDGRVMGWLRAARTDLQITGVDLAQPLPPPPPGTRSQGGIAMESLPFANGAFAAAVSQFGFEYGRPRETAGELARVVVPGGSVALLTHRGDGPIVAQNRRRRDGIRWAIEEQQLPGRAQAALTRRARGGKPVPPTIARAPARGEARFGKGSPAWEIAEAIRQTLDRGRSDDPARVAGLIDRIQAEAIAELARISALEAACLSLADEPVLQQVLAAAGLFQREVHALQDRPGVAPFADFRLLTRVS